MTHPLSFRALSLALSLLILPLAASASGFTQPRPGLHTGGQPKPEQLAELSDSGVHTVIDLRGANEDRGFDERAKAKALGMHYISLPIHGADGLTPANASALKQALGDGNGVLLHCGSGNRVGALLAMIAVQYEGATKEEALALGREAGLTSMEAAVVERLETLPPREAPSPAR